MATTTALRIGLNQGISSGNLVDTKIVLYSHRDSSGRVSRPKTLYANSQVLKTVPYFNNGESIVTLDAARAEPHTIAFKVLLRDRFRNSWGWIPSVSPLDSQPKDSSKAVLDDEEFAEDYGYISDSDLEDDGDEKVTSSKHTTNPKGHPFDPFGALGEDRTTLCEEHEEDAETAKVVKIPDMAFVT